MITNKGAELMYNAAIVAAAEAFVDEAPINRHFAAASVVRILDAVEAQRAALRPKCDWFLDPRKPLYCGNPATQKVVFHADSGPLHRCDIHRVTVTEL